MMRSARSPRTQAAALVGIENLEHPDEARAERKGVLLCTAHIGGMDLIGPA